MLFLILVALFASELRVLLEKRALFYPLIDLKFLSLDRFTFALAACQGGLSSTGGSVFC